MKISTQTIAVIAVTAVAFASLTNAHLKLSRPVPYGIATLNRSPLVNADPFTPGSGSDYPCKQRTGVYDIVQMNNMPVGEPQELSFLGTVSHGGGTCQLTITKDKEPTPQSVFKIFQVFEGGCPVNSDGNTPTHPFTFVLPKGMPNGVMTFAWFWYNRIGDRELYMNCAPVNITGGSSNDDFFNSLPNAYLINLPATNDNCQSTFEGESNAVTIPHPGQYILRSPEGQEMHAAFGNNCTQAAAKQLEGVVGYQSAVISNNGAAYSFTGKETAVPIGSSGAATLHTAAGSAAPSAASGTPGSDISGATTTPASAPAAPSGSGSAGSAGSGAPAPTSGSSSTASGIFPPTSAVPTGSVGASSAAVPSTSPSSGGSTSGAACDSSDVAIKCSSDGKQFGVCDHAAMVWRAVAPGTTCKNGQITKRSGFSNPHVRRPPPSVWQR